MSDTELDKLTDEWIKRLSSSCDSAKSSIHGVEHWRRVERNGLMLAEKTGANVRVVRFFAVFHDACRINDDKDSAHGLRAAALVTQLEKLIPLSKHELQLLRIACAWHNDGKLSKDPTVGTCWDADRMDLVRLGFDLNPDMFSTAYAKEIVLSNEA